MRRGFLAAAGVAVLSVVGNAQAVVIIPVLSDNFDGYANQAAFEASWTPIGTVAPISAELSTAQSVSPTNSVRAPGTATTGQNRNQKTFAETSTLSTGGNLGIGDQVIFSFDFYDADPTGSPQRNFSNLQDSTAPAATNQLIAMGCNNNQSGTQSGGQFYMGRILGYTATTVDPDGGANEDVVGSGAFFKLNDFAAGARSLGWHNLKTILSTDDGLSTDYQFFVDNVLAERVSNVGTAASIRSFDNIRLGSGLSNGSIEAFFDNMNLTYVQVPEPASLGLIALGIGALVGRRRA